MLVFIDDSGDAGFKLGKGSSRFFVIALVIFDDDLEAEKTAIAIKDLRRALNFSDASEFKFFKSRQAVREDFLRAINPFNWRTRCIVIDKSKIYSDNFKNNKASFYSYAIKSVLKNNANSIKNARIKIDGSGDRIFRKKFVSYLRQHLNSEEYRIMKNCKLVDSKENVLIQMADMVAGSIRRSFDENKTDGTIYKEIFKKHIQDEWKFQ